MSFPLQITILVYLCPIMIYEYKLFTYTQDVGVCYAFVEFEDMSGVHNAVKVLVYF